MGRIPVFSFKPDRQTLSSSQKCRDREHCHVITCSDLTLVVVGGMQAITETVLVLVVRGMV